MNVGRSVNPKRFLTSEESVAVEQAIASAEQSTTGELKLVIVRHCWRDIRARAEVIFHKLGLYETKQRNAVLIVLVTANHEFLIYGDEGIHQQVGPDYWCDVCDVMRQHFHEGRIGDGLCKGIAAIAEKLSEHFPKRADDINELTNEVAVDE